MQKLVIALAALALPASALRIASLDDAWAYADLHNPGNRAEGTTGEIARKDLQKAWGKALLPDLALTGTFTQNLEIQPTSIPAQLFGGPSGSYVEATFGRRNVYMAGLQAHWNLVDLQAWRSTQLARNTLTSAELNQARTKASIRIQVAVSYYQALLLKRANELAIADLDIADSLAALAARDFSEGNSSLVTYNSAEIKRREAARNAADVEQQAQSALIDLGSLLDLPSEEKPLLTENLGMAEAVSWDEALPPSYDVTFAQSQVRMAESRRQLARASFAPTLALVYQNSRQVASNQDWELSSDATTQESWGIRLEFPLLSGLERTTALQKANLELERSRYDAESARNRDASELEALRIVLQQTYQRTQASRSILSLHQDNVEHAQRLLEQGLFLQEDYLRQKLDCHAAELTYLRDAADYWIQVRRLEIRRSGVSP